MRFSIIVPVHNTAAYLPACIDSILAQTCRDFELVLVDDGSTDDSAALCREAVARDARVRLIRQENRGVSHARNTGLAAAAGRYVTMIDSDDTVAPDMLAEALALFERTACDLVIFSMRYLDATGESVVERTRVLENRVYASPVEMAEEMMRRGGLLIYSAGNKFYRRDLLERHRVRFEEGLSFGEDRLFNYAYLRRCGVVVTSSRIVYDYYSRGTPSLSRRYRPRLAGDMLALHLAKRALLLDLGLGEDGARNYLAADIRRELLHAIAHVRQHWRGLDGAERLRAVRALVSMDYPDYLRHATTPRWSNRLMLALVRARRVWAVHGLIWATRLADRGVRP